MENYDTQVDVILQANQLNYYFESDFQITFILLLLQNF